MKVNRAGTSLPRPTRRGRMTYVGIPVTATTPHNARTMPLPTRPESTSTRAAGAHTSIVPNPGTRREGRQRSEEQRLREGHDPVADRRDSAFQEADHDGAQQRRSPHDLKRVATSSRPRSRRVWRADPLLMFDDINPHSARPRRRRARRQRVLAYAAVGPRGCRA
jgi:hypothetical protein